MRFLVLLLSLALPSLACSCAGWPSAKEAWSGSPVVFSAWIERVSQSTPAKSDVLGGVNVLQQEVWVRVTEAFKGVEERQLLKVLQPITSCSGPLKQGAQMLLYLQPDGTDAWRIPWCHRSTDLENAVDDLHFLRRLPASADGNRLSGEVELYEDSWESGFRRVRGLPGATVTIRGQDKTIVTATDADGFYEVYGLPPGSYTVTPTIPNSYKLKFSTPAGGKWAPGDVVTMEPDTGASIGFVLYEDNQITGHVYGPGRKPLPDVCVDLVPAGRPRHRQFRAFDCTEKDGSFDIHDMPAGSYLLVANEDGKVSASEPFPAVYYPGTDSMAEAHPLVFRVGEKKHGIDIVIPEMREMVSVSGRLVFSDGQPAAGQSVEFRPADKTNAERTSADVNGIYSLQVLKGSTGELLSQIFLATEDERSCPELAAEVKRQGSRFNLSSGKVAIVADRNVSDVQLTFPVRSCDGLRKPTSLRK